DFIKNGNSFKPVAETTTNDAVTLTTIIPGHVTLEEKAKKKNDVKARSMLLMALPIKHLMTFNQYKDAKTLFAAIKTRFGRNEATKKTQKTLLKQLPNSTSDVPTVFRVSTASPQTSSVKISAPVKENTGAPLIKDWESDEEDVVESPPEKERKNVEPSVNKVEVEIPKQNDKPARRPVKYAEMYRKQKPRGNQRNWNNLKSHQIDQGYFDSGCSRYITRNISYLTDFKEFDGGYVAFGRGAKGGKITGKGTIRTATKDETSRILKSFITEIENLVDKKIKIIRCDNETEFKNRVMNEFYEEKSIKREYIIARTPQQNKNRVLVVKLYFKTPYELFRGRTPALSFMRPFRCHVTILNTLDHLGKIDGKSDEGFFVGYSTNSKAFRVYNTRTRKVEENLHIKFLENKPLIAGDGPKWLLDIDTLKELMNYVPVSADSDGENLDIDALSTESKIDNQERPNDKNNTKDINTIGPSINTASSNINTVRLSDDYFGAHNDMKSLDGVKLDISNLSTIYPVSTTPNTRINKDHSLDNVIDVKSTFLYGRIEEVIYVCQPPGFEDPDYLDKYLLDNGFRKGKIDQTLFIKRQKEDILLVQVYVDDIIFGSAKKELCTKFEDKYVDEILRKFKYKDVKPASTPMNKEKALLKYSDGDDVDVHLYRSMIGSLMYLTSSRPDIMFDVCTCAHSKLGLWYPKDSSFDLETYTDSDYAGASLDRKSTSRGC
nr:hypothetical protein [Tanacetum cinerariifolium]